MRRDQRKERRTKRETKEKRKWSEGGSARALRYSEDQGTYISVLGRVSRNMPWQPSTTAYGVLPS